jgi:RNA-directed DNA polymerase
MRSQHLPNLLGLVLQSANILRHGDEFKPTKGPLALMACSLMTSPAYAKERNWKRIMTELRSGQSQPSPVRRVKIVKPYGVLICVDY